VFKSVKAPVFAGAFSFPATVFVKSFNYSEANRMTREAE
jgi:hypothetical protein